MYSINFPYTGAQQTWEVPQGVYSITIEAWGASGGGSGAGKGGYSKGTISVTPGETLYIYVGQQGFHWNSSIKSSNPFNGGGACYKNGYTGGGASDVRRGGNSISNRIIVAGGGGGGYPTINGQYSRGGDGGGGNNKGLNGGNYNGNGGGQGGGNGVGGSGGKYATAGTNAVGGTGNSNKDTPGNMGGSGGGGGYGGGGGGGYYSGGGGGGGYIVSYATNTAGSTGVRTGNGLVVISYDLKLKYLFNDNGAIKAYVNREWKIVGTLPINEEMFLNYGMDNISAVDAQALNQLSSNQPELLTYSPLKSGVPPLTLDIVGNPISQLVVSNDNFTVNGELSYVTVNSVESGNGLLRYIVSNDNEVSWRSYKNGQWIFINPDNKEDIILNGMTTNEINSLTKYQWNQIYKDSGIKVAYFMDISDKDTDIAKVNTFSSVSNYSTLIPKVSSMSISYNEIDSKYYGILFMDENGEFYSTSFGELLKYLNFGTLIAGQTSLEFKVLLMNSYNFKAKNIKVMVESNIESVDIDLSKTTNPFLAEKSLLFDQILNPDDIIEFYIRVSTTKNTKSGGSFSIKLKADPIN